MSRFPKTCKRIRGLLMAGGSWPTSPVGCWRPLPCAKRALRHPLCQRQGYAGGNVQEKAHAERRQNEPRQDALSLLGKNENGIGDQRAGHNDRSGDQNWIQFRVSLPEQIRAMPPNALLTCVLAGASLATARVVTAK